MKYLVAVSGGVDSVVLLDMLSKSDHQLVVAHVDHGIRGEDSAADARFVAALAKRYRLPFVSTELHLGKLASEERARAGRYDFLFAQAKKFNAIVVTAHHQDDMVETVALNLTRGTGWRGLAVLDRQEMSRPLLALSKAQIYEYAVRHRLEWVEDATNHMDTYLRNRLRAKITTLALDSQKIAELRAKQLQLRRDIDREATKICQRAAGSRYFMNMLDRASAVEVLGAHMASVCGRRPVRAQLERALHAIKTAKPGSTFQAGDGISLTFTARNYQLSVVQ